MYRLTIKPGHLTLPELRRIANEPVELSLDPACHEAIHASSAAVSRVIEEGRVVYGINTGFGLLANTRIVHEDLALLQRRIVLSHAAGVGELMSESTVRLMTTLKVNSLARGFSGIRLAHDRNPHTGPGHRTAG